MIDQQPLSDEQQQYLAGFVAGCDAVRGSQGLPTFAQVLGQPATSRPRDAADAEQAAGVESLHRAAQDRFLAEGNKLSPEEKAKREKNPFEMWDEMRANAEAGQFPKGTDVFLYKFHGLFYVAPAQDAFMCRLRFAGGITNSHQLCGVADIAEQWGGGYADVTTRANLQIREVKAPDAIHVVTSLHDLGILNRGTGADNIRNITGTPTAGIDPQELIDTRPLAKEMHHYILEHRELYGLPRKFNIAFDGGGTISALADTNDIGFMAVRVGPGHEIPEDVYFRLELGGITGHQDFARDCGVLLTPGQCVPVAAAIVRVFLEHGDRTDRKRARLKYLLDAWSLEKYLAETEKHLAFPLRRFSLENCLPRGPVQPRAHLGVHPQRQPGKFYVGVVLPVGRMTAEQMRSLAGIADRYGSGSIRLTVWQNLLISDIHERDLKSVERELEACGLHWSAANVRAGLVACTGNAGCKYSASNTKRHALQIADYLDARLAIDMPINIHLTGCHHSCAQHYIGDIGLLGTKVPVSDDMVEGYHVYLGGGYGENRAIGREYARNVPFDDIPPLLEQILSAYLSHRLSPAETFAEFSRRHTIEQLGELAQSPLATA